MNVWLGVAVEPVVLSLVRRRFSWTFGKDWQNDWTITVRGVVVVFFGLDRGLGGRG